MGSPCVSREFLLDIEINFHNITSFIIIGVIQYFLFINFVVVPFEIIIRQFLTHC